MADMRDRLAGLLADMCNEEFSSFKEEADHLLANGLILPPCKVGDTVYCFNEHVWDSECCDCEHYRVGGFGDPSECGKTKDGKKAAECIEIEEVTATYRSILSWLSLDDFGRTVFLTREEAEKALREKEK